jgi:hypothetical protein
MQLVEQNPRQRRGVGSIYCAGSTLTPEVGKKSGVSNTVTDSPTVRPAPVVIGTATMRRLASR